MADVASLVFDIDSSGALGAAKALAGLNKYAAATATVSAKLETQFRKANGQFQSQIEYVAENERAIRQLAAAYNPVLDAQLRYAEVQKDLARAVQLGVISVDQQADALRRAAINMDSTAHSSGRMSKGIGSATHQIQNMGYQISDIAVQLAGGQNPFLVFTQQLPQMIGGLGVVGAVMGTVAAVVGVTAMQFMGGSDAAKKFNDALDSLGSATDVLNEKLSFTIPSSFDAILQKYGSLNASVRETVANVEALNMQLIALNQTDVSGLFSDQFGSILLGRLDEIKWAFDTTYDRARRLQGMIEALDAAKGPQAQIAAYDKLIKELIDAAGGINNMTKEQVGFIIELEKGRAAAIKGLSVLDKYTPSLNSATSAASGLLSVMQQIANTPFPPVYGRFDPEDAGLGSVYAPMTSMRPKGAPNGVAGEDWAVPDKAGKNGGAASKAASELKAATKAYQSLRELMEQDSMFQVAEWEKRQAQLDLALNKRLITQQKYAELTAQLQTMYFGSEYEQNALRYEMSLQQLNEYLEKEYLTRQQYEARKAALQWEYNNQSLDLNSTQLGANLNGLAGYFSQASSLAGGGYAGLLKAQQSFAAASAFISAYSGAAQALGDPTLTTFQKIAAAGKVLTTGLGFVNAIKGAGSGGGGGAGATSSAVATPARVEPEKTTLVRVNGPDWLVAIADDIMKQIYKETKNGRVIIAGYNG